MSFWFRISRAALVAPAVVCLSTESFAQAVATPRAPQGFFGGVRTEANAKTKLDVAATLVEGYDDDVPTQFRSNIDPSSLSGGFWTMLNVTADYSRVGKTVDLRTTATSNVRHYVDLNEIQNVSHGVGAGLTWRLPQKTTFVVNQGAAYSPTYLFDLFPTTAGIEPGSSPSTALNYSSIATQEAYGYATALSLRHDFTPRVRFTAGADYNYTDRLRETAEYRDVSSHSLTGDYSQNVTRSAALTAQYHYRASDLGFAAGGQSSEHGVEFGMNYLRPLSPTRKVLFNFQFGVSGADFPEASGTGFFDRRRYLGTGNIGLGYEFARTWQVLANYRRGIEYVLDLPQPVFADGVATSVAGMLSRRVDVLASAGYSSGESLLNRNGLLFDTYTGNLRVRVAMTRSLATYLEYLYYYYDFRVGSQFVVGLPPGLERNGVRAGVTLWMPAVRR